MIQYLHDLSDKKYWRHRWTECYPNTYPPELFSNKRVEIETGWWIFKRKLSILRAVCVRCGERIGTGHYCRDLMEE